MIIVFRVYENFEHMLFAQVVVAFSANELSRCDVLSLGFKFFDSIVDPTGTLYNRIENFLVSRLVWGVHGYLTVGMDFDLNLWFGACPFESLERVHFGSILERPQANARLRGLYFVLRFYCDAHRSNPTLKGRFVLFEQPIRRWCSLGPFLLQLLCIA